MTVKQIVINKDMQGRITDITIHHHENNCGPIILLYNPPVKVNLKIPMPNEKHDMGPGPVRRKKKHVASRR